MSKPNHNSLKYKVQAQPNKTYKDLKQKQKLQISEWMFREVCEHYREHGTMPPETELDSLAKTVYAKIQGAAIWVPYDDVFKVFTQKQTRFAERIAAHGLPELLVPKQKKSEAEKISIKRKQRKNKKKKEEARLLSVQGNPDQDDNFFFIAGYTSGGAPYGVTWEEMGLNPWQRIEDIDCSDEK